MSAAVEKELQDKLLLELLDLIEQSVRCKVSIESTTNAGQLLLVKSRYIEGAQSVSAARLPTENSSDFNALKTVNRVDNELTLDAHKIDKENGFIDPIRWFGVVVPRSLALARDRFNQAVELAVESANVQLKLNQIMKYLLFLRNK